MKRRGSQLRLQPFSAISGLVRSLAVLVMGLSPIAATWSQEVDFESEIAPLLARRCLECHNETTHEAELDLTTWAGAQKGGESGAALVPRDLDASLLWKRVHEEEMPPEEPLADREREMIRAWILAGAPWQPEKIDRFRYSTPSRAGYDWWALRPWQETRVPQIADDRWSRSDIDRFILARLKEADLQPSPEATPRELVRRLYFDLIGLPPTAADIEQFEADPSEDNYRLLVDRLLDSPEHGERWARHWLDVARYGESDGFERNNPRTQLWHYRDWVIDALNRDLPYDEFVRLQLAGDLLKPGPEGAAAAGFLVAGVHNTVVGGSERMKRLARQDELEELVGAVGQTFLGLTVNCARCHDHKFDPVSSIDYYRMIAALDGVNHGERELHRPEVAEPLAAVEQQLAAMRDELNRLDATVRERVLKKRSQVSDAATDLPRPMASWNFEQDLKDQIGDLHGEAVGTAQIENGALVLDGQNGYVKTAPLQTELKEKTLEAWVLLDNLEQRGGGVISVQTSDGAFFDAIVYGEREVKQWMAGSNTFARTQSFQAPQEGEATATPVHVAITYQSDGTITGYRNGLPYGKPYQTGVNSFAAEKSQVLFGLRHSPTGGNRLLKGKILRANLYDHALEADAVAASAGVENEYVAMETLLKNLTTAEQKRREALVGVVQEAQAKRDQLKAAAKIKVYTVAAGSPGAMRIHLRGGVTNFGPEVSPGGVAVLGQSSADFGLKADAPDADRRKKLAEWVTRPEHPLMARVMVNRLWQHHFGIGLVETPNDFGFNGGRPSHTELVNWLAQRFRDHGYRLKPLHREMVLSATYRQSSKPRRDGAAVDADNRLLWRYPMRRVDAEYLRDAMLSVSGVLNPQRGGPGFQDVTATYINGTTYYEPIDRDGPEYNRRTIYRFSPRGGRSAVLDTFDCPDPSATAPRRSMTTTPLQALTLMNNAFVLRMSRHMAQQVRAEAGDDVAAQIRSVWRRVLLREPTQFEAQLSGPLVQENDLETLCRALFNSNEFVVIE